MTALATDPATSEALRRAMWAAAEGRSTLGIPKAVGKEFVGADATAGHAAGILFVAPDGDILLLRRSSTETNFAGHWALPGGKAEDGETPEQAAEREAREEMGGAPDGARKVLDQRVTPTGMAFHTFAQPVADKFVPKLNDEHTGYAWAPLDMLPGPIHPAVKATLTERLGLADDMTPEDWTGLRTGFAKWTREEELERAHDAALAFDRAPVRSRDLDRPGLAFDRQSVRTVDKDGRLRIARTHISKSNICPYIGSEIPNWRALGLDANRIYKLFRDPEELAKAAHTFNGIPLLSDHVPVTADQHDREIVLGTTGTEAVFEAPYLDNSLIIWTREGIDNVESEEKKELSCAYHYVAVMEPGYYLGEPFDGRMTSIVGNHVTLVEAGRTGADVVVGDSALPVIQETDQMTTKTVLLTRKAALLSGAVLAFVTPKLAQDAKLDFGGIIKGVTSKNFKEKRPGIITGIQKMLEGKLAKDASIDAKDLEKVLDVIEAVQPSEVGTADALETDPSSGMPMAATPVKKTGMDAREFLAGKLNAEDMKSYDEMMGASAVDEAETEEEKKKREEKEKSEKEAKDKAAKDEENKDMVTKHGMDAAIKAASETTAKSVRDTVMKEQREIRQAHSDVRPYVGELSETLGLDSGEKVLRHALKMLNVADADTIHGSALRTILLMQPKAGARETPRHVELGMDAASIDGLNKLIPGLDRITTV